MAPKPKVQISCIQGYDALLLSNRWLQESEKNSTTAEKAELLPQMRLYINDVHRRRDVTHSALSLRPQSPFVHKPAVKAHCVYTGLSISVNHL